MSIHVAILKREYLRLILTGQKRVESRLMKHRMSPFRQVAPGDRLYFKASGGPFMAMAVAESVTDLEAQRPEEIDALAQCWNPAVCGEMGYWHDRRDRPFVTLVRFDRVEPIDVGPAFKVQNMRAWYVLPDEADPVREVVLSGGAIRNRYLSLTGVSDAMRGRDVTLVLPDGHEIATDFARGGPMLRWRGWGAYYEAFGLREGDHVRLVALGGRRYGVRFVRRRADAT